MHDARENMLVEVVVVGKIFGWNDTCSVLASAKEAVERLSDCITTDGERCNHVHDIPDKVVKND